MICFHGLSADHPRIRGEHYEENSIHDCSMGSSPHTRGAHDLLPRLERFVGIIPAYAGSTTRSGTTSSSTRDHPRIRGEHKEAFDKYESLWGSSPHTRGAPPFSWAGLSAPGIIPAYAGSTS